MTAPDFMPRVGNIDIYQFKDNFVIGGPRALCEGRLSANLSLQSPEDNQPVFSSKDHTLTAVVAQLRSKSEECPQQPLYDSTHYMADNASDIFAPGWDVTYNRDSIISQPYYHTAGLGSPFLEDVKLCAAANGMWPAASPDAARTFKRTTRTAMPLTDQELGLAKDAKLAVVYPQKRFGWDGEHGPYLSYQSGRLVVNYSSISRSDYISNYMNGHIDFSDLRPLDKPESEQRLATLASVNRQLLGDTPLSESDFWLVSFIKVEDWTKSNEILNLPDQLIQNTRIDERFCQSGSNGYLLIFVRYSNGSEADTTPFRRLQPIDSLHCAKAVPGASQEIFNWSEAK